MLTSGPPELPGLIAASVWRNDSYSLIPTSFRSVAEMMPGGHRLAQAERRADRHDQLADLQLAAVAPGQRADSSVLSTLITATSDLGSVPTTLADGLDAVVEGHGDLLGVLDDVVIGQDVAAVVVDEPGAGPLGRGRRTAPSRAGRRGRRTA